MDDNINYRIYKLKQDLDNLLIDSQLPIGTIYLIMEKTYKEIERLYNVQLQKECSKEETNNE